jgi:hypothetical protein
MQNIRTPPGGLRSFNDVLSLPFGLHQFINAWEDLPLWGSTDKDYNDMVILVSSIKAAPIPEPATMLLLGLGILGIGVVSRTKLLKR